MPKYKMLFTAGGNYREGAVFEGDEVPEATLKGWIKMGAVEETKDKVSDPSDEAAMLLPHGTAEKAAEVSADAPMLTTGSDGGSPMPADKDAPAAQEQGPKATGTEPPRGPGRPPMVRG